MSCTTARWLRRGRRRDAAHPNPSTTPMITITTTIKEVRNGDTFNIHHRGGGSAVRGHGFERRRLALPSRKRTVEVVRKFLDTRVIDRLMQIRIRKSKGQTHD